jgi:hypothetical protein
MKRQKLEWSKTYGPYSGYAVIQTVDGGYSIGGVNATSGFRGYSNYFPIIVKTGAIGDLQWAKTYNGEFGVSREASSIMQTADLGYALCGYGGWILKLDALGNVQWSRTYGLLGQSFAIQTSDGGYVLIGSGRNSVNRDAAILVKTDDAGIMLLNKTFSTGTSSSARASMGR